MRQRFTQGVRFLRVRMFLAVFLSTWLGLPAQVYGQQPAPPQPAPAESQATTAPAPAAPTTESLKILVLQGQNAINSIQNGLATMPVVEVHDENDQVLEGADVTFELPASGPGGTFPGGQLVKTVKSNLRGQAGAAFMVNSQPGKFAIKVAAVLRNRTGHITINQTNTLESTADLSKKHKISWWKIGIAAGGAALVIGIVLATRGGSSSSSSSTITVTPGTPTFGTP
jgi:hypothetical protein